MAKNRARKPSKWVRLDQVETIKEKAKIKNTKLREKERYQRNKTNLKLKRRKAKDEFRRKRKGFLQRTADSIKEFRTHEYEFQHNGNTYAGRVQGNGNMRRVIKQIANSDAFAGKPKAVQALDSLGRTLVQMQAITMGTTTVSGLVPTGKQKQQAALAQRQIQDLINKLSRDPNFAKQWADWLNGPNAPKLPPVPGGKSLPNSAPTNPNSSGNMRGFL